MIVKKTFSSNWQKVKNWRKRMTHQTLKALQEKTSFGFHCQYTKMMLQF
jgi:hypothetical protein